MSTQRILIVDDDGRLRAAARAVLQEEGFEVDEAANGADALKTMRQSPAHLVLCDMFMPDKDGLETIRELRREFPNLRILAISGGGTRSGLDVLHLARVFGAVEVLNKPLHRADLLNAVHKALGTPQAE